MARIDIKGTSTGGGGTVNTGVLQIINGVALSATLRTVADQNNTASPLRLSTTTVTNYGGGAVTSNTAFGVGALTSNTTGADNTAVGNLALNANLTGQWNTAVGHETLSLTTGSNNTAVGRHAAKFNTTGAGNTAIGTQAGSVNATGTGNTAVGYVALQNNTNSNNTAVGYRSLNANVGGNQNSGVGVDSLLNNTSGIGNTAVGYATGGGITTGNYNTILGANVTGLAAGLSNNIILADGQGNQRLSLGSTGQLKLSQYTGTSSFPGTTAGFLAFDSSGNILSVTSPATSPSGVAGSVQFSDGTAFASDATNFFWNNTTKRLGIGTNSPQDKVEINGNLRVGASSFVYSSAGGGAVSSGFYLDSSVPKVGVYIGSSERVIFGNSTVATIKGSGSTSATTSLLVQNSAAATALEVKDNLTVGMGAAYVSGASGFGTTVASITAGYPCFLMNQTAGATSKIGFNMDTAKLYFSEETNGSTLFGHRIMADTRIGGLAVLNNTAAGSTASLNASAVLQADSTTRGFLPPRMTNAQRLAIATPAVGLMVYCTDAVEGLYIYKSTGWTFVI